MSDQAPKKFYPYYRVSFLVNGTDKESSFFSIPADLSDPLQTGNLAADIVVSKSDQGIFGSAVIRIYNLSVNHRNMLFHEPYWITELDRTGNFKRVHLQCGYLTYNGGEIHFNWTGLIQNASSYKQGDSIVTEVVANELGYISDNAFIQFHIEQGQKVSNVFQKGLTEFILEADYTKDTEQEAARKTGQDVSKFFPEKNVKFICDFKTDYKFEKEKVINAPFIPALKYLMSYVPNARMYSHNNIVYITDKEERNDSDIITINAENGLQSTPRVYGYRMTLSMMFEPRIFVGQTVKVESMIQPNYNDEYTVIGFTHHLTLGDGTRPTATTEVNLKRINIAG